MKNWLDKFDDGGDVPSPLNDPKNKPIIYRTEGGSHYDPIANNIYFNPLNNIWNPEQILKHEGFHWAQNMHGALQYPDLYPGPLRRPQTPTDPENPLINEYYNRADSDNALALDYMKYGRNVFLDEEGKPVIKDNVIIPSSPSLQLVPDDVIWRGVRTTNRPYNEFTVVPGASALRYSIPDSIEGDAKKYEDTEPTSDKPIMGIYGAEDIKHKHGGLIKRADGSYSRRGLWDNIRANRGSGRKPTAEMLRQERKIKKHEDGGWIDMYADGDVVTGENPPSRLQELAAQYQAIQEQVNKGDIGKKAYLDKMRSVADDLIAKGFALEEAGILPESVMNNPTNTGFCIGTSCYLADQAGDKFYPQGSSFFTSNSAAQDYAKSNPKASRYLEQDEKFITPGDIIQFKSGEKGRPYHAYTVYDLGQPNEDGDRIITVVGSPGHGQMHKKTYILGKDNKIYSDEYGMKSMMHDTQLLKRREDNTEYNNLLAQRDALKQQILEVDPTYFTPKEDIRSGDYRQTGFMLNDQGQGNEYGRYVQTENGVKIQTPNPGMVDQAYNAKSYIDASKSGLTEILAKYNDPQYKYDYMRTHNISNNEYDALVSNMVGIYGAESKFGTDYTAEGKLPEWPWLSKLANAVGFINEEERSIGPFQMTYNQLPEKYRKTIKSKDLYDANIAADATMEYLTAGLPLLRKRANTTAETATERNPYSQNITKDNYLEYVPYLYNMRGWLKGDESTMEKKGDILRGDAGYKQLVDQYRNNVLQIIPTNLTTPESIEVTPQQRNGGYVQKSCCNDKYNDGSWVTDSSIPTPTSPSFYDAGEDRTLTNYQMGTDKAFMYGPGGEIDLHLDKKSKKDSPRITPQGFLTRDPMGLFIGGAGLNYKANDNLNISPYVIGVGNEYFQKFPVDYGVGVNYPMGRFNPSIRLSKNPGIGMSYKFNNGGPVMYNAGSTVWTNQDTPLWAAGTPTPTATQNFRNTGSLNTNRYRIGDVIPTGMDYKTPAAGTHDYNQDVQPPKKMVYHAPDTLRIGDVQSAKHGGHIKKHINSPRVYGNPVNPSGMYADGSTVMYGRGGGIQDIINQQLNQSRPQRDVTTITPKNLIAESVAKDIATYGSVERAAQAKAARQAQAAQSQSKIYQKEEDKHYNPEQEEYRDDTKLAPEGSTRATFQNALNTVNEAFEYTKGTPMGGLTKLGYDMFVGAPAQSAINLSNTAMGDRPIRGDEDVVNFGWDVANVAPFIGAATKGGKRLFNLGKNIFSVGDDIGMFKGVNLKNPFLSKKFEEAFRRSTLKESTNPNVTQTFNDFKTRINTPEGTKRLIDLGITDSKLFNDAKFLEDDNAFGYFNPSSRNIGLHPELSSNIVKQVTRHEIEHLAQEARKISALNKYNADNGNFKYLFNKKLGNQVKEDAIKQTTKIDDLLSNLELRKTPEIIDWDQLKSSRIPGKKNASELTGYMTDKQRATNYFHSGSEGGEKSAFLAEVQQYMMNNNIIPSQSYVEITPEMVNQTFIDAMFDETGGGKYLRLFNIMKPTEANYKLVAEGLNKMLGVGVGVGVGAGMYPQQSVQKQANGGYIQNNNSNTWLEQYN